MPALIEHGRAKVNLTLRVVGRRVDGYHDLESVVAFADCADRLSLVPGSELGLKTTGPLALDCGEAADNLVFKAAQLLRERVPDLRLGEFTLDKSLPVAAGIGGGSADAAAALRLLAQLNGLALDDPRLIEVAQLTGADVPVCLASRACVMTGVGETLQPLSLAEHALRDGQPLRARRDARRVQRARPAQRRTAGRRHRRPAAGRRHGRRPARRSTNGFRQFEEVGNDLEAPALSIQPVIGEVLSALSATDGVRLARMSGSGATCFAIFENAAEAQAAAEKIRRAHPAWWVHAGALS